MISCANHDYVEIACMYRLVVKLVFRNGQIVQGKALQTAYNEYREECIVLDTERGNEQIVLEQVASMEAVTKNPHFEKINFG
ncbi:Rho-binding antiterminator [Kaarinaea lacus]